MAEEDEVVLLRELLDMRLLKFKNDILEFEYLKDHDVMYQHRLEGLFILVGLVAVIIIVGSAIKEDSDYTLFLILWISYSLLVVAGNRIWPWKRTGMAIQWYGAVAVILAEVQLGVYAHVALLDGDSYAESESRAAFNLMGSMFFLVYLYLILCRPTYRTLRSVGLVALFVIPFARHGFPSSFEFVFFLAFVLCLFLLVHSARDVEITERRDWVVQRTLTREKERLESERQTLLRKNQLLTSSKRSMPLGMKGAQKQQPRTKLETVLESIDGLLTGREWSEENKTALRDVCSILINDSSSAFRPALDNVHAPELKSFLSSQLEPHQKPRKNSIATPRDHLVSLVSRDSVDVSQMRSVWLFDPFMLTRMTEEKPLQWVTMAVLEERRLINKLSIPRDQLISLVEAVECGYLKTNPYHNHIHASEVVRCMDYLISRIEDQFGKFPPLEVFAAILAAMIHDYQHPGLNNDFHVKNGSALALTYNDRSVLESYHLAAAFSVMRQPRFDVLSQLDSEEKRDLRVLVIKLVLATDISRHYSTVGKLKAKAKSPIDFTDPEERHLLLQGAIKMADLSHCSMSKKIHVEWSTRVCGEFFMQGDRERALGIPVSPFMDRSKQQVAKSQIGFFDFIVLPLYESMRQILPSLAKVESYARQNYSLWQASKDDDPSSVSSRVYEDVLRRWPGSLADGMKACDISNMFMSPALGAGTPGMDLSASGPLIEEREMRSN
eukprot:Rmarinus@m.1843